MENSTILENFSGLEREARLVHELRSYGRRLVENSEGVFRENMTAPLWKSRFFKTINPVIREIEAPDAHSVCDQIQEAELRTQ